MLTLAAHFPENYANAFEQSLILPDESEQKEAQRGVSHALLGLMTGQHWGLNADYVIDRDILLAIVHHHHPQRACIAQDRVRLLIGVALLAQTMVSELVYQVYQSQSLLKQSQLACQILGLSDAALSNIRKNLAHDWFSGQKIATSE